MNSKTIIELQVEKIQTSMTDRDLRVNRYRYVDLFAMLISVLSLVAAGVLVLTNNAQLSDDDLQDVAIGLSAVIATVVGFFILFSQIVLNSIRDVEREDVTAIRQLAGQLYRDLMTRQVEFQRWASHFGPDFEYTEFARSVAELAGVKSIDDVPDFSIWRTKIGPVTRGAASISQSVNSFQPSSDSPEVHQREYQALLFRYSWDINERIGDLIAQIDWHIQVSSWSKYRNQPHLTSKSIISAVAALLFSVAVSVLAKVGLTGGTPIPDQVNVFTVAGIWIGTMYSLVHLGAVTEAMLEGREEYIDRIINRLKLELAEFY
ncbi:MAG: hypothetical protein HQ477_08540 [Chloroflexi bacterium]|nr:hypothetical protein [Chloroflexota bacterium]